MSLLSIAGHYFSSGILFVFGISPGGASKKSTNEQEKCKQDAHVWLDLCLCVKFQV
jgi:hypothetical protein